MKNERQQRFEIYCATGDKIVAAKSIRPSEVSCYAIVKAAFNKKANGGWYTIHDEWLRQRHAVPGAPPVGMPAPAAAELESWADDFKAQLVQRVTKIVGDVAGIFDQTTSLRVTALEGLCSDQARSSREVLATLLETEAELGQENDRNLALEAELKAQQDFSQRLLGRIEQLTGGVHGPSVEKEARSARESDTTTTDEIEPYEPPSSASADDVPTDQISFATRPEDGVDADAAPGGGTT